jgi:hypothetical protein
MKQECVLFGPYFTSKSATPVAPPDIRSLSLVLEWSSPNEVRTIPLFRWCRPYRAGVAISFDDILFRSADLPFDVTCPEYQVHDAGDEVFLPLDSLLYALYASPGPCRPIFEVLRDLAQHVPLRSRVTKPIAEQGLLAPKVEATGYHLNTVVFDGEAAFAEIGWRPNPTRSSFHTCVCRFETSGHREDRDGKWQSPAIRGVSQLLTAELRRFAPGPPLELFTQLGRKHLLGERCC